MWGLRVLVGLAWGGPMASTRLRAAATHWGAVAAACSGCWGPLLWRGARVAGGPPSPPLGGTIEEMPCAWAACLWEPLLMGREGRGRRRDAGGWGCNGVLLLLLRNTLVVVLDSQL